MIAKDISERIALLRFILIFGVVILHTPEYVYINDVGTGWFDLTKAFFQNAAFRCTVPVLACFSGYLLFNAGLDLNYRALLRKKFRTLFIPFLAFNTTLAIALLVAQAYTTIPISVQLYPLDTTKLLNALFSFRGSPLNYPLYFLRDLIVLMLLAPVFGWLLRNTPYRGIILIFLVGFMNLDGDLFLRQQMPMMFYLGGLVAVRKWNLRRLDRFALPCLLLFIAACCAVLLFKMPNTRPLRLCAPFMIWPAAALLCNTSIGRWMAAKSKYSFFIFLAHAPLVLVLSMVYKHFKGIVPYEMYWAIAPVVTVVLLIAMYDLSVRVIPGMFGTITGAKIRVQPRAGAQDITKESLQKVSEVAVQNVEY